MRIISGKLKKLNFFPSKGFPSHPTTDFAKEALFSILSNEIELIELQILDLFSGTGNISYEFASREAGTITAVEKDFKSVRFIREFCKKYKLENAIRVIQANALTFLENSSSKYDIIFADPPYDFKKYDELINIIFTNSLLKEDGIFVLEHGKDYDFSEKEHFLYARKYGGVVFSFFKFLV